MKRLVRPLVMGLLLCVGAPLGCCFLGGLWAEPGGKSWRRLSEEAEQWRPEEIAALGDTILFTDGVPNAARTRLWRLRGGVLEQSHTFEGPFGALSGAGTTWFAQFARMDADAGEPQACVTFRSTDDGRTWEERGVQSPALPGALLALSDDEVWVVGDLLYRSLDGGRSFQHLPAPTRFDTGIEAMGRDLAGNVLLMGQRGVFRIGRDGTYLGHDRLDGSRVVAASGGYFAGEFNGIAAVRRDAPGATWMPILEGEHRVIAMAAEGELVRVFTGSSDPFKNGGSDVRYHVSTDGGRTWRHERTGFLYKVFLSGRSLGLARDYVGRLYVPKDEP